MPPVVVPVQETLYPATPPNTVKVAVPLVPLKQRAGVVEEVTCNAGGCVMAMLFWVAEHPLASVTVTL